MAAIAGNRSIGGHPQEFVGETEVLELAFGKLSVTEDGDGGGTYSPNLENHFFLQINEIRFLPHESHGVLDWINPYLGALIKPYVPSEDDQELIAACKTAFEKNHTASIGEAALCKKEIAIVVLAHSDPKALIAFSRVSKSFYWLTKSSYNPETKEDAIWDTKLNQLLPEVERIPLEKTRFTPEQQYKITLKRMTDESKLYLAKFDHVQKKSLRLKEEMYQIWTQLLEGQEELDRADQSLKTKRTVDDATPQATVSTLMSPEILKLRKLQDEYAQKEGTIAQLSGMKYNGSHESILRTSELGDLLNVINVLIPEAFNKQAKFEEVIEQAETAKNNSSSYDSVVVEEVYDPMNVDDK